jgi:vinculin
MARLSALMRGESAEGVKRELIATARQLADESLEISRLANTLASNCTDKRMRNVVFILFFDLLDKFHIYLIYI